MPPDPARRNRRGRRLRRRLRVVELSFELGDAAMGSGKLLLKELHQSLDERHIGFRAGDRGVALGREPAVLSRQ